MIHYFNPGHETAVLNNSKYYHPPANQVKMQADLASLPAWYANRGDYVLLGDGRLLDVSKYIEACLLEQADEDCLADVSRGSNHSVDLWGISPQAVYFFEQLSCKYNLNLNVPLWKNEYKELGSRKRAHHCLSSLINSIPAIEKTILPLYLSSLDAVEQHMRSVECKQVLKSPYSSSGRGLLWLPAGVLAQSEKQIIKGMLKRQQQVSIEKALDKVMDFSMHFNVRQDKTVAFLGYSVFHTNNKGAYQDTVLASQAELATQIGSYISEELMNMVKVEVIRFIKEAYSDCYQGFIGVDMLVYQSGDGFRLNPCVEINMRKSMGLLSLQLFDKYINPNSNGQFFVDYSSKEGYLKAQHDQLKKEFPLLVKEGKIHSGYLSLCPVDQDTNYRAYLLIR